MNIFDKILEETIEKHEDVQNRDQTQFLLDKLGRTDIRENIPTEILKPKENPYVRNDEDGYTIDRRI